MTEVPLAETVLQTSNPSGTVWWRWKFDGVLIRDQAVETNIKWCMVFKASLKLQKPW